MIMPRSFLVSTLYISEGGCEDGGGFGQCSFL